MKGAAVLAAASTTSQFGFAQEITTQTAYGFPNRTIRIIGPTAAGGGNDFMARYVVLKLSEQLGRQVIVENRPGAAGLIGSQLTANAPPDGYTLLMASTTFSMVAAIQKLSFDPSSGVLSIQKPKSGRRSSWMLAKKWTEVALTNLPNSR